MREITFTLARFLPKLDIKDRVTYLIRAAVHVIQAITWLQSIYHGCVCDNCIFYEEGHFILGGLENTHTKCDPSKIKGPRPPEWKDSPDWVYGKEVDFWALGATLKKLYPPKPISSNPNDQLYCTILNALLEENPKTRKLMVGALYHQSTTIQEICGKTPMFYPRMNKEIPLSPPPTKYHEIFINYGSMVVHAYYDHKVDWIIPIIGFNEKRMFVPKGYISLNNLAPEILRENQDLIVRCIHEIVQDAIDKMKLHLYRFDRDVIQFNPQTKKVGVYDFNCFAKRGDNGQALEKLIAHVKRYGTQ